MKCRHCTDYRHTLIGFITLSPLHKLVCGERSGALWLPSHHPGGCCTLVVDEETPPSQCRALWVLRQAEKRYINVMNYYYYYYYIVKDSLCICSLCYNRALWDRDELRCQLLVIIKEAARILPCLTMHVAAHACFSVKNNSVFWMLMLSLNNKYFIGSVYAGMLWSLGDVTERLRLRM